MRFVKRLLPFLSILFISSSNYGQTIVSGDVSGVWTKNNNPYIVADNINIVDSLIITPGVIVKVQVGGLEIKVENQNKFKAVGSEDEPIIFEPYVGQAHGIWQGITISNSGDDDTISNCIVQSANIGLQIGDSSPLISDCVIHDNIYGLVLGYYYDPDTPKVRNCIMYNNDSAGVRISGYDRYGPVSATIYIQGCTIYNNKYGIDIYSGTYWSWGTAYCLGKISNCTISNNQTGIRAYAYRGYADAKIVNTIISFSSGYGVRNQDSHSYIDAADITYNCLWGNESGDFGPGITAPGFGQNGNYFNSNNDSCDVNLNIYYKPMFIDTSQHNYNLQNSSKCINAGTDIVFGELLEDPDGTLPDIGAHYYDHATNVKDLNLNTLKYNYVLEQNYPNPFNPLTKIRFYAPKLSFVSIKIYNVLGRLVTALLNKEVASGEHEISFDASKFPSGVYFYKLQAGKYSVCRKMVVLK